MHEEEEKRGSGVAFKSKAIRPMSSPQPIHRGSEQPYQLSLDEGPKPPYPFPLKEKDGAVIVHVTYVFTGVPKSPEDKEDLMNRLYGSFYEAVSPIVNGVGSPSSAQQSFSVEYKFSIEEPKIVISSTFTLNTLLKPLQQLISKFSEAKVIGKYGDFLQQLLDPNSDFGKNKRGINVLLFRFDDLYKPGSSKNSYQQSLSYISDKIKEYTYQNRNRVPLLICCCPNASETLQWREALETTFLEQIRQEKLVSVLGPEDIKKYHPSIKNIHNSFGEKEAHLPYTIDYFSVLAERLARIYYGKSSSPKKVIIVDGDNTLWKGNGQ